MASLLQKVQKSKKQKAKNNPFSTEVQSNEKEIIACTKCDTSFFEEVLLRQYVANHTVVLGQRIPPASEYYVYLRCAKCGALHEPNLQITIGDAARAGYDKLLDEFELTTKPVAEKL